MSIHTPIPRQTRQSILTASEGQTTFGPFDFPLFDEDDVQIRVKAPAATEWTLLGVDAFAVHIAPPAVAFPALFSVTLVDDRAAGDQVWIKGARLPARQTNVTRAGKIQSQPLEEEFDVQAATQQELRRDIDALIAGGAIHELIASGVGNDSAAPGGTVADALETLDERLQESASISTSFIVVRAVALVDVDISSGLAAGSIHDGVTVVEDDTVLLPSQTDPAENGVYKVPASGPASRVASFSAYDDHPGKYFSVAEGDDNERRLYHCISVVGGTLGVDPIIIIEDTPTRARGDLIQRGLLRNERLPIGPAGSHLQSDGTDAGWALFLRPAIGAVARSWLAKATDFVSVLDFGLDPTGATSCTAKFNAAIAACPHLYFPPGTYKFDTAPAAIAAGSYCLRGAGWNTIIQTTFATGDAFVFSEDAVNARSLVIQDLYFISTVTRTSGATIRIWGANQNGSSWSFLNRINILGTCNGIQVDGGSFDAEQCGIGFITGSATVPGSAAITLNNALNASHLKSVTVFGSTSGTQAVMPSYGIRVIKAGELTMNAVDLILAGNALYVSPPSGVIIQGIAISDSFFDTSGTGAIFTIDAGSTGVVRSVKITNSWFSNNTGNGLAIGRGAGATGSVGGFDLVGNTYIANSAGAGVVISDASVKGVNLIGGVFAQNSIGYAQTVPGVSDFKVIGAFFGAFGNFAGNTYDIYLGGGAQERFNVSMNTVTAAVASQRITTGTQTGTTGRVHDNPGYNSVGAANVTTAASPWTYTAGVSPETLYVSATTGISAVTQGGVSILPAALAANVPLSVQLGPNESVVLTYTGTLSAKKMVH